MSWILAVAIVMSVNGLEVLVPVVVVGPSEFPDADLCVQTARRYVAKGVRVLCSSQGRTIEVAELER